MNRLENTVGGDMRSAAGISAFCKRDKGGEMVFVICFVDDSGSIVGGNVLMSTPEYARDLGLKLMDIADAADRGEVQ